MTKLKGTQKIILEAMKIASKDEPTRDFTKKDREGRSLFSMMPHALTLNKGVTRMDEQVYAIILGYCIRNDVASIRISQKEIAYVLGTTPRMISRSTVNLESLDWLVIEHHPKATSTYHPRRTETSKAKHIRLSMVKLRKKDRLQEAFSKQTAEAEEAKKNLLKWFKNLSEEEAIKFYQEHKEDMDYIDKEDSESKS